MIFYEWSLGWGTSNATGEPVAMQWLEWTFRNIVYMNTHSCLQVKLNKNWPWQKTEVKSHKSRATANTCNLKQLSQERQKQHTINNGLLAVFEQCHDQRQKYLHNCGWAASCTPRYRKIYDSFTAVPGTSAAQTFSKVCVQLLWPTQLQSCISTRYQRDNRVSC